MFDDLRGFLKVLDERGLLRHIPVEVDWNLEIGAIQRRIFDRDGPALFFERVRGHDGPVVSGVLGTLERYALAIGCEPDARQVIARLRAATQSPIPPALVDQGGCQQVVETGDAIDVRRFPTPYWHPLDGGRYIGTLGLVITRDPETGARNVGIYREQILGPASLGLNATQQIGTLWQKWRRAGRPMPVATVLGVDPASLAASCLQAPLGVDELGIAGALRGRPVELVRCLTQDLAVPAAAEIVLEGEIAPDGGVGPEGPFGEFTGFYGVQTLSPTIDLTAVTYREKPIFQGTLEGAPPSESTTLRCLGQSAGLRSKLERMALPGIKDVYVTDMGCANFMVVASIEKQFYFGHARQVVEAIWASTHVAKWVIIVDEDIDVFDRRQVEWALSTRVAPHRDVWITPQNQPNTNLDPAAHPDDRSYPNMRGSRIAVDATLDFKGFDFPPRTRPAREECKLIESRWPEYGLD